MGTLRQNHGYWVTVFGFPKGFARKALQQMRQFGTITDHKMPTKNCNWFYVRYSCLREARKAAKNQDAELLTSTIMIGVKLRGKRGVGHLPHGQLKPATSQLLPTQQLSNVLENEANDMTDSHSDFQVKQEVESDKEEDHTMPYNFCPDSPNSTKPLFTTEQSKDLPIIKRVDILCDVSAKEKQDDGCFQPKGLLTSSPQLTAHRVTFTEATDDRLEKNYSENFGNAINTIKHVTVKEEFESDHDYTHAIVRQPVITFDGNTQNFASDIIRSLQLEENVEAVIDSEGRHGNMEEKKAGSEDLMMTVEEEGGVYQIRENRSSEVAQEDDSDSPDHDICSDDLHDQNNALQAMVQAPQELCEFSSLAVGLVTVNEDKEEGDGGIIEKKTHTFSSKDKKAEKQPSNLCEDKLLEKEMSDLKQTSAETSHGQQKKKDGKRQCDVCGYSTKDKSNFTRHVYRCIRRKAKQDKQKCDVCGYSSKETWRFSQHMLTHAEEKKYACDICGYATNKKNDLTRHVTLDRCFQKGKAKPDRKKCDICGYVADRRRFAEHMRTHLQVKKPLACDVCGYATNKKSDLTRHMYTHTQDKQFVCEVCGKRFLIQRYLDKHLISHSSEKQFMCSYCGQRFAFSITLRTHIRSHTGETPFTCNICDMKFTDPSNLYRHRIRKHGKSVPVFQCSFCEYSSERYKTIKEHEMHEHTKKYPCKCDVCGWGCIMPDELEKHMTSKHMKQE